MPGGRSRRRRPGHCAPPSHRCRRGRSRRTRCRRRRRIATRTPPRRGSGSAPGHRVIQGIGTPAIRWVAPSAASAAERGWSSTKRCSLGAQQLGEAVAVDRRRRMAGHLGRLACHVPAGDFRSGAPAHVRDHQPPRRGQDHAHREVPAVRRCDHVGRRGQGARGPAGGDVRLDGHGAEARDLDHLDGAQLPLPRSRAEPARHAGPPRLLRGHLPRAVGRRRRGDGARLGQGHRTADAEAVRGLPLAQPAGDHVPQQARPSRHGAAGTARPDRGADRPAPDAGDLAGRVAR